MNIPEFQHALLGWFDRHGRKNLPWQTERTPYRVWVSEIMLQQTQVATVIPYFERFMARFPDVRMLADAAPDDVIALWAGLGYYARVRNLHLAAQRVAAIHGGELPNDSEALAALPGIGRSTAGAILSLGFGRKAAILDGNVKRVLCRYAGLEGWPGDAKISRELWQISEAYTPENRAADYNQAMMDLGATLCRKRQPDCPSCPVRGACVARKLGIVAGLPTPKPRRTLPIRECLMLFLHDAEGAVYLEQRPPVGIWGGLWSLPEFEDEGKLRAWCGERGIDSTGLEWLPQCRHTFSHFHLDYVPVRLKGEITYRSIADHTSRRWLKPGEDLGVPAPVRRLLEQYVAFLRTPNI